MNGRNFSFFLFDVLLYFIFRFFLFIIILFYFLYKSAININRFILSVFFSRILFGFLDFDAFISKNINILKTSIWKKSINVKQRKNSRRVSFHLKFQKNFFYDETVREHSIDWFILTSTNNWWAWKFVHGRLCGR